MQTGLNIPTLPPALIEDAVRRALGEDLGLSGDLTSLATIPPDAQAGGSAIAEQLSLITLSAMPAFEPRFLKA